MADSTAAPAKPGIKTTEFWMVLSTFLVGGGIYVTQAVNANETWQGVFAFAASALTAMGYTVVRYKAKSTT